MNLLRHVIVFSILVAPFAHAGDKPSGVGVEEGASKDGKKPEPIAAQTLLEKGRASGSLPDGMVIRIGACLGESEGKAPGDGVPDELRETWEFTSRQVHRVVIEDSTEKRESRSFDTNGLCQDLLEGKAIEIQARNGEGPEVAFAGTHYHRGSRRIEVIWNGATVLDLGETNGAFLMLYRESDARAFGALYERLASQARAVFQANPGEAE